VTKRRDTNNVSDIVTLAMFMILVVKLVRQVIEYVKEKQ
jgi:hypothetical protein